MNGINYTPITINIKTLVTLLSGYNDKDFIVNAFVEGFNYDSFSPPTVAVECKNLRSATNVFSRHVKSLIYQEVSKGFLSGPYISPPVSLYRVNPLGVVEGKYSSKLRLIVDLSSPHNDEKTPSINGLLSKDEYSLSYVRLDDAIKLIQDYGPGTLLCKTDIADAFKQLPLHPSLWPFHGVKWDNQYFFYTRLVFGSRASPKLFDTFASAIQWIMEHKYNLHSVLHLLDDFLLVLPPSADAQLAMKRFISVFSDLNVPLSAKKTEGPTCELEYLGIVLDTKNMEARLPSNKLDRIRAKLDNFLNAKSCTKRELLSLLGHLNFASRVVYPGRSFISRIIEVTKAVQYLDHYVNIGRDCRLDIRMWKVLLSEWNGISLFLEPEMTGNEDMLLFTDASGIGYGGIFGKQWFQARWTPDLLLHERESDVGQLSIAFQELYPIVVAALIWGKQWARKRILFKCDNMATVQALCKGRSKSPAIMKLMRRLVLVATKYSFAYSARHLSGNKNLTADALSRFQTVKFRRLAPHADLHPQEIPREVMFA